MNWLFYHRECRVGRIPLKNRQKDHGHPKLKTSCAKQKEQKPSTTKPKVQEVMGAQKPFIYQVLLTLFDPKTTETRRVIIISVPGGGADSCSFVA